MRSGVKRCCNGVFERNSRALFPHSRNSVAHFSYFSYIAETRSRDRKIYLERIHIYIYFLSLWCSIELEEQCWAFIDNDELFSEDTAFLLYLEAKKVRNTAVMELMVPRIMKFFLMLVSTKDFLDLAVDELCLLLRSNYISVNRYFDEITMTLVSNRSIPIFVSFEFWNTTSEMEVLMSAVRWLMHDWANRKENMLEVLKCVRFGLIAPWQLVDVKRNPENPEFMELMSSPDVQKMVDDGLA